MRGRLLGNVVVAALMAVASIGTAAMAQPAPQVRANLPRGSKKDLFGNGFSVPPRSWGYADRRIGMAEQKRVAKKSRNVRRNRNHQKG